MEEFLKLLRGALTSSLYLTAIIYFISCIVDYKLGDFTYAVTCLVLALLIDILSELKKFNDKNK